jgi:hypothetical protein
MKKLNDSMKDGIAIGLMIGIIYISAAIAICLLQITEHFLK